MDGDGATAPGWYADPTNQHESRYWDGSVWTDHVSNQGVTQMSAVSAPPPVLSTQPAAMPPAPMPSAPMPPGAMPPGAMPAVATKPPKSPEARAKTRAVLILIAGGLMAIGALLPWEEVTANGSTIQSVKGLSEGAGGLTLAAGLVVGLLAVLLLNRTVGRKAGIATLVVAAVALVFVTGNMSSISDDIDQAKNAGVDGILSVDATLGIGIIMAMAGCIMAVVVSILLLRIKDAPAATA